MNSINKYRTVTIYGDTTSDEMVDIGTIYADNTLEALEIYNEALDVIVENGFEIISMRLENTWLIQ